MLYFNKEQAQLIVKIKNTETVDEIIEKITNILKHNIIINICIDMSELKYSKTWMKIYKLIDFSYKTIKSYHNQVVLIIDETAKETEALRQSIQMTQYKAVIAKPISYSSL